MPGFHCIVPKRKVYDEDHLSFGSCTSWASASFHAFEMRSLQTRGLFLDASDKVLASC